MWNVIRVVSKIRLKPNWQSPFIRSWYCALAIAISPKVQSKALTARDLGDDPVFAFMNNYELSEFMDERKLDDKRNRLRNASGLVLVIGTGATLLAEQWDVLVYCDMARWELQQRQRAGKIANLGLSNLEDRASLKYKRAFFVDWRAADRLKKTLFSKIDFLLDTNDSDIPKLITGEQLAAGLQIAAARPFRVVPFFDPGPWGGQWMKEVCDLPRDAENYAWCFDCVPEENSLLLGFGDVRVEVPSINLVFTHPHELLGEAVHGRFGTEFPDPLRLPGHHGRRQSLVPGASADRVHPGKVRHELHPGRELLPAGRDRRRAASISD